MRIECQKNDKRMEINNFQDSDFRKIEEYFYQDYFRSKYIDRRGLYEYIDTMRLSNSTSGRYMDSDFPISMYIYLD